MLGLHKAPDWFCEVGTKRLEWVPPLGAFFPRADSGSQAPPIMWFSRLPHVNPPCSGDRLPPNHWEEAGAGRFALGWFTARPAPGLLDSSQTPRLPEFSHRFTPPVTSQPFLTGVCPFSRTDGRVASRALPHTYNASVSKRFF